MKHKFDPGDENRLVAPLSQPSAAMGEGLGVRAVSRANPRLFSRELFMKYAFDPGDENRLCDFAPLHLCVKSFSVPLFSLLLCSKVFSPLFSQEDTHQ
jgi:hypothetical protein